MDIVFINGLTALTTIGVYAHERNIKQELKIDLEMAFNNRVASTSDDINDALDYDAISNFTLEYLEASQHFLIETAAEKLSQLLLKEFPIKQVKVTIRKPDAVKAAENIGVKIIRP